jgi:glycosyltransferase involved in cell wall biosynthesis
MDILWYSPIDIESTEIARYSSQVLPFVAGLANIVAVQDGDPAVDQDPTWWREIRASLTRQGDAPRGQAPIPVYHIGNNPTHLPIHGLSAQEPGIIVLHDISLVDLAKCLAMYHGDPELWQGMMHRQYGDIGRDIARHSESSDDHYQRMLTKYPLFLPFVEKSLGVVVHSSYAREILMAQLPEGLPVVQLNLPYPCPTNLPKRNYATDEIRFVFCGHVGPNRRLAEFFEAWGQLRNPKRIRLDIFGKVRNTNQLERIAVKHGVASLLNFRGYVEDEILDQALREAHFALNLRWPTMGETSASQLRYWSLGLPTLVTDIGWYGDLPEEVVCKVSAEDEVRSIQEILEGILESPASYEQRGVAGWKYLRENHGLQDYAAGLVEFVEQRSGARLAYRMLDTGLVNTVASMCDKESALSLFRDPVDIAVELFDRSGV